MAWIQLLTAALGIGKDHLKAKADLKMAKTQGEIAITNKKAEHIETWEQTQAKGSTTSWKDEFWTLIWSIPLIMCFIPGGAEYALAGFESLKEMPEWYTYTLMTIVLASFGIRLGGPMAQKFGEWRQRKNSPEA